METKLSNKWKEEPLSTYADVKGGNGFPLRFQEKDSDIAFLKVSDLGERDGDKSLAKAHYSISKKNNEILKAKVYPANTIIFAKIGAAVFLERKRILNFDACIDNNLAVILPKLNIDVDFLYYLLANYDISNHVTATALPSINIKDFLSSTHMFPELPEQKVIAKVLSDIDKMTSQLKLEKVKLENFKLAQIYSLLNPKSLSQKGITTQKFLLSNIAIYSKGRGQNKSNILPNGEYPCILYGELFTTYSEVIENVASKSSKHEGLSSISGDVLIPGSTTTVGRDLATASVIRENGILLGGDINIIRISDFRTLLPEYFAYLFKYILVDQVEQMAQGTTIKHLYGKEIIKLNINLPHIDYQTQVTEILSITEKRIRSVQAELEKYDCIKQGMLHDLLARKVRLV